MPYAYKISVAISTYNRASFLPGLMDSIFQQNFPAQNFEILLVNNNSTDQTETLCQQFIQNNPGFTIRYFIEKQQGLSFARNRCIQEAKGEYITFADDDALLSPSFLENVCNFLDNHKDITEVGGPIQLRYLGKIPNWENPYINALFGYFKPSSTYYELKNKNRKYPRGSNMTFRSNIFTKCGNFNTNLGRSGHNLIGGEEKDMAFRIIDAGYKIAYLPNAIVFHLVPENRTTLEFIKNQAIGIGISEQIRAKAIGCYQKQLFIEILKWNATLLLWLRYCTTLHYAKANILIRYRYWISTGLVKTFK